MDTVTEKIETGLVQVGILAPIEEEDEHLKSARSPRSSRGSLDIRKSSIDGKKRRKSHTEQALNDLEHWDETHPKKIDNSKKYKYISTDAQSARFRSQFLNENGEVLTEALHQYQEAKEKRRSQRKLERLWERIKELIRKFSEFFLYSSSYCCCRKCSKTKNNY